MEQRKPYDHFSGCRKATCEHLITIYEIHENSQKTKNEGNFLNLMKDICEKLTANIIFNGEKLNVFLLISETGQDVHSHNFFRIVLKGLRAVSKVKRKEIKGIPLRGRIKIIFFFLR